MLTYLITVGETPEADLAAVFEQLGPRAKEAIVTTAEMIEARGKERGRAEALLEQMSAKFGPLPAAAVHGVRTADPARVRTWATRILTAATLDELFV